MRLQSLICLLLLVVAMGTATAQSPSLGESEALFAKYIGERAPAVE